MPEHIDVRKQCYLVTVLSFSSIQLFYEMKFVMVKLQEHCKFVITK